MPEIVRISTLPIRPLDEPVEADKLVSGAPMTGFRPATEDETRGFHTGLWESEPGAWTVDYSEDELCVIVAGRVRLTPTDGAPQEFGPGDAFVIPRGFKGTWETVEQVRKVYAILL